MLRITSCISQSVDPSESATRPTCNRYNFLDKASLLLFVLLSQFAVLFAETLKRSRGEDCTRLLHCQLDILRFVLEFASLL
jgi:hypothetical protein